MRRSILITIVTIIVLWGCSNKPKKQPAKYTDYDFGNYLYYIGKTDSAFLVYNRYVNNADDTIKKAETYRYMGKMLWDAGDLHGAEENLAAAIHTLDPGNVKDRSEIGYSYNLLGNINLDLKHYDSAIGYYNKAINISVGTGFVPEIMNGKATALQKMKHYSEAIAIYDSIFMMKPADQELVARITDNRARTKWLQEPVYPALPEYWLALKIRTDSQYNSGLNASYAHLSDYYTKPRPDSALWYAQKMFEKAGQNESPADKLEAMDKLIRLNNTSNLKEYWYAAYKTLNDSLQFSRDTTRSRFAMIRYDFQKSKADNLVLQQHITRQRQLMYGVVAFAIAVITGLSGWYAKRRKRIKQETENAIRNSRLKTSQRIHDVVANGLYGLMNELEHNKTIEREPLITRIEGLYEKSRDISYEDISTANNVDYDHQVHDLITAFANEQTKVIVVGNQPTFWNRISGSQKDQLRLILHEIMINMQKHSHAKNVVMHFRQEDSKGFINYKDDGVGFNAGQKFGNGLNNTVSRIKSLNGEVIFEKKESGGISIEISFPLQSSQI